MKNLCGVQLWFDVEERYKTIAQSVRAIPVGCGLM